MRKRSLDHPPDKHSQHRERKRRKELPVGVVRVHRKKAEGTSTQKRRRVRRAIRKTA